MEVKINLEFRESGWNEQRMGKQDPNMFNLRKEQSCKKRELENYGNKCYPGGFYFLAEQKSPIYFSKKELIIIPSVSNWNACHKTTESLFPSLGLPAFAFLKSPGVCTSQPGLRTKY